MSARSMARVAMMAAVTAALAQVAIPLPGNPVPVTLQVLGVLLAGLLLPPGEALRSQAVYVALGAVGLPVFAGGTGGLQVVAGPTGGYLWGFLLGAPVTAWLRHRSAGPTRAGLAFGRDLLATAAGVACVYAAGVAQLAVQTGLPLGRAVVMGAVPFIPWDLVKAAVAVAVAAPLRRALQWVGAPAEGRLTAAGR